MPGDGAPPGLSRRPRFVGPVPGTYHGAALAPGAGTGDWGMTAKLNLDGLPGEIAERARAVFGGVVNDLDQLLKKLGSKLTRDTAPTRKELLKLIETSKARLAEIEQKLLIPAAADQPAEKHISLPGPLQDDLGTPRLLGGKGRRAPPRRAWG